MRGEERLAAGLEAQSLGGWGGGSREPQDCLSRVVAGQIHVLQSPLAAARRVRQSIWMEFSERGVAGSQGGAWGNECVVIISGRDEL